MTFLLPSLAPQFKPIIVLLVTELLTTLWWLVTFALLADDSRRLSLWVDEPVVGSYWDTFKSALGMTQASAVFGAFEFVLFVVCSGVIISSIVRKHSNGGPVVNVQEYPKEARPQGSELA